MKITQKPTPLSYEGHQAVFSKEEFGLVHIKVENLNDKAFAMGVLHATDRPFQMEITRLIAQGRLSECVKANKENTEIDIFMRGLNLYSGTDKEVSFLDHDVNEFFQSYCRGVDYVFQKKNDLPKLMRLLKHKPAPWKIQDTMAITKLMSYVGLAQAQQDVEKLIIQSIQKGTSLKKLKSLFAPHLDDITNQQVELIKKVKFHDHMIPNRIAKFSKIPLLKGSNNWIVNGSKSFTGSPVHSLDPHLECNRLPAIWYEFKCEMPDNYFVGVNMPGVPGTIMGRSKHTAFSFTYGFMDTIDYFIEDLKDEKVKQFDEYRELELRSEIIKQKKGADIAVNFYSTPNGTLDLDPKCKDIEDGYYLARSWSGTMGASGSLNSLYKIHTAKTAPEMQVALRGVAISCNWLVTDDQNNIAYQQSGRAPKRAHSGLYPIEGWIKENMWQGFLKGEELASCLNPDCGYIVTANDDGQVNTGALTVNLHMGSSRVRRITDLLNANDQLTIEDHQYIQNDLFSVQAEDFINKLKHHLPSNSTHTLTLNGWNFIYDKNSRAAVVFEKLYQKMQRKVFGEDFIGKDKWKYLEKNSGIIETFYHYFDRILLNPTAEEKELWFDGQEPMVYLTPVIEKALKSIPKNTRKKYYHKRKVVMRNIFIGNVLPKLLKQNYGPIIFEGSRATVNHASIYKAHGRLTSFAPSYRMVTDMSKHDMFTILAGGQSEHRKSPNYCDQVEMWLSGKYKKISAESKS